MVYNLSRFENVWILTSNDPKYPHVTPTPNLQNKKSLSVSRLQFELSQALIDLLRNEIFKNKPKPEVAHKTGSRTNSEKISGYV